MQQTQVRTPRRPIRVVIIGAGIGGLAAGAILRRDGHEVTVLERAERFEPLGAGLALWPNGARALREIGVGATADAAEVPRGDGGIRRARDGKLITAISPEVLERRYGAPARARSPRRAAGGVAGGGRRRRGPFRRRGARSRRRRRGRAGHGRAARGGGHRRRR